MFDIGQKVVCIIEHERWIVPYGEIAPYKGGIYTVRGFDTSDPFELALYLEEIVNQQFEYAGGFKEGAFNAAGFRPVIQRPTEISVFTKLLGPKVREDA